MKTLTDEELKKYNFTSSAILLSHEQVDALLFEALKMVRDEIEKRNRWIPCSERLPEKEGRYLITFSDNQVYDMEWKYNKWLWDEDTPASFKVKAWKELPEPFKE